VTALGGYRKAKSFEKTGSACNQEKLENIKQGESQIQINKDWESEGAKAARQFRTTQKDGRTSPYVKGVSIEPILKDGVRYGRRGGGLPTKSKRNFSWVKEPTSHSGD